MHSFPNFAPFCWSMSVVTVAFCPIYRFLKRQVRWSGIPISLRMGGIRNSKCKFCTEVLESQKDWIWFYHLVNWGLPWWLSSKESACQWRRCRFIHWVGKITGEGNGNPLLYSCLGHPVNRGVWRAAVHGGHKTVGHALQTEPQTYWIRQITWLLWGIIFFFKKKRIIEILLQ